MYVFHCAEHERTRKTTGGKDKILNQHPYLVAIWPTTSKHIESRKSSYVLRIRISLVCILLHVFRIRIPTMHTTCSTVYGEYEMTLHGEYSAEPKREAKTYRGDCVCIRTTIDSSSVLPSGLTYATFVM